MKKPIPVALQLYSVRDVIKQSSDLPGVLRKVAGYGYVGVELAGMYGKKPAELRAMLEGLGLKVVSNHGAMPSSENRSQILDEAAALGYSWHISGQGPEQFKDKAATLQSAATFKAAAEALKGTKVSFGIHNHWWEFDKSFDGKLAHQVALDAAPGVLAEIDTYWVTVGGADAAAVIRALGKRAPLLHIKDGPCVRDKAMTAVGDGKMDWKKVFASVDEKHVKYLIVELDSCDTDMMTAVERSAKFLIDNGYGKGRQA
jgi:sugar phosphate isomerase/epimerase